MDKKNLKLLIQQGEGTTLEFKEGLSASFSRELVALANTIGGKILLGVRDDGSIVGVSTTNTIRARVQDAARNCDPPVKVLVEAVDNVLVVTVRESDVKPVQCSEGFYWRQGAVTQKLSRIEIRDYFRAEGAIRFDLSPCPKFRYPQDFDRKKFDAWFQLSGISGKPKIEDVLVNIDVAERVGDNLLFRNAGVLFFAKNVRRFFNQAYITCLLGKGTSKVHVLDRKDFDGGIVSDIEDTLRFIERNTRVAWKIETLQRQNIPEYPLKAMREAVINAIMHRDWFMEGANVFIEIYSDRTEIISPGGLPKGMSISDLGHKAIRRNPLIADLLYRIDFIEKAGTGINRIREESEEGGYPLPEWETNGFTTVIFHPNAELAEQVGPQSGAKPSGLVDKARHESSEGLSQGSSEGLSQGSSEGLSQMAKLGTHTGTQAPDLVNESRYKSISGLGRGINEEPGQGLSEGLSEGLSQEDQVKLFFGYFDLLNLCENEQPLVVLLEHSRRSNRTKFKQQVINPLMKADLLEYTVPDKPNSRLQRYRLTATGRRFLKNVNAPYD